MPQFFSILLVLMIAVASLCVFRKRLRIRNEYWKASATKRKREREKRNREPPPLNDDHWSASVFVLYRSTQWKQSKRLTSDHHLDLITPIVVVYSLTYSLPLSFLLLTLTLTLTIVKVVVVGCWISSSQLCDWMTVCYMLCVDHFNYY